MANGLTASACAGLHVAPNSGDWSQARGAGGNVHNSSCVRGVESPPPALLSVATMKVIRVNYCRLV